MIFGSNTIKQHSNKKSESVSGKEREKFTFFIFLS